MMFTNIIIPSSVKAITRYVSVTITTDSNENTTNIANPTNHSAFQGMTSLTNKAFAANNITRIGTQTFKVCSSLAASWKVKLLIVVILSIR